MKLIYGIVAVLALGAFDIISAQSSKIDAVLQKSLQRNGHANVLVSMKDGTQDVLDKLNSMTFSSRTERSQAVYDALNSRAEKSQSKFLRLLSTKSISEKFNFVNVKSFWITNQVSIEFASSEFIGYLASMDEVSQIQENMVVQLNKPFKPQAADEPVINANQWGVTKIQAPEAWAQLGQTTGTVVIGNLDSGVRYTHETLQSSYVGGSYSWFDAIGGSETPRDDNGHGTHTTGTMIGSNGIGVAAVPSCKWIACKGLDRYGSGTTDQLLKCAQWFICPTTYNGNAYNCSASPHIVSNSWGSSVTGHPFFDGAISAWHTANIIPVFSIGNDGTACGTARSPGDRDVIGVGSTDSTDRLSVFSSTGPTTNNVQQPEISAPGTDVTSASYQADNLYLTASGTSMACPHVAGTIGLLLSKNPNLTYAEVKNLLQSNSDQNLVFVPNRTCGGRADNVFPNNHFGSGRLNAYRALQGVH